MADDLSIGPTEFSADEEKQQRDARRASNAASATTQKPATTPPAGASAGTQFLSGMQNPLGGGKLKLPNLGSSTSSGSEGTIGEEAAALVV